MKKRTVLLLLLLMIVGIAVLAYPSFSDYLNRRSASYAIFQSTEHVDEEMASEELQLAEAYNASLLSEDEGPEYTQVLDFGEGLMGSLEIPKINVYLPIYHGTSSDVLAMGIGHLEGSALPVGGVGNHTVLTGHTGLPSAELLTDLTEVSIGDVFYIHIPQKKLCYQVTDIQIVLPDTVDALLPEQDKDRCTLVTCTPYGVNSHRLLVCGERIEERNSVEPEQNPMHRVAMPMGLVAAIVVIFLLSVTVTVLLIKRR